MDWCNINPFLFIFIYNIVYNKMADKIIKELDYEDYKDGQVLYANRLQLTKVKINDIIDELNKRSDPWENFK